MVEVKKAQPWAGNDQRQGKASAQGMRGFYLGEEMAGWKWERPVDIQSCGHVGRWITAQCLFHHVLCRRDVDLHATCSWARKSRVQDTVGAKIPQWCKRHWASQSKSHRELLITNQQPWLRKSRAAGCCQGSVQGQLHDTLSLPCPEHWLLAAASDGTQGEMNIWAKLVQQ